MWNCSILVPKSLYIQRKVRYLFQFYPFLHFSQTRRIAFSTYKAMEFSATHCVNSSAPGAGVKDMPDEQWKKKLTPEQYRVLRQKGTDPLHGPLDRNFAKGTYHCAGCHTPLYDSSMKWDCGCGWPGFWDCFPDRVREVPDADGSRTEILCHACNSHLGHVFRGEGFRNPPPNERHCVNSTSLIFVPSKE